MATILAVLALIVSVVAAGIAMWNGYSARRSADAAEGSHHAADRAADAAKDSAETARRVADLEARRMHEEYRPQMVDARFVAVRQGGDGYAAVFEFTVSRDYRIAGWQLGAEGRLTLDLGLSVRAGERMQIYLGLLSGVKKDDVAALPFRLDFQFWPPAEGDEAEPWTCRCGQPDAGLNNQGPGHWEQSVTVELPPGNDPVAPQGIRIYGGE